jgi:ubiquitin C-terminal hydrolase
VKLDTLPKVLIVQLKRFKMSNNYQRKLTYAINIPHEIQLDFLLKDKEKHKDNTLYSLSAIVVHVGSGNDYGHYYCLIKISGTWFIFNDEKVDVN